MIGEEKEERKELQAEETARATACKHGKVTHTLLEGKAARQS